MAVTESTIKTDSASLEKAKSLSSSDPSKAESIFKEILARPLDKNPTEAATKNVETALLGLGELYRDQKRVDELAELILQTRQAMASFAKAKTAKLGMNKLH
jgi:26S proteasome regulatory subunit N6